MVSEMYYITEIFEKLTNWNTPLVNHEIDMIKIGENWPHLTKNLCISSSLTSLCRQEMASIEYHLLLSATETQRHLHTLQKWEEKTSVPSSSTAPPSSSSHPSFVPLSSFLSPHSPLPTMQEDTQSQCVMSSILFQRSPLKVNTASHGGYCTTPAATESHDNHMTSLNLGTVSYGNCITSPNANKESHDCDMIDPATKGKSLENHMTSPTIASKSHDSHETDHPALVKSPDSHMTDPTSARKSYDSHVSARQLFSPETGVVLQEPAGVSVAREELAALVGEKQRMEARHRRLVRRLMELRTSHTELQEVYTCTWAQRGGEVYSWG